MSEVGSSPGAQVRTVDGDRVDPSLSGLPPLPPLPRVDQHGPRARRGAMADALFAVFAAGGGVAAPTWLLLLPLRLFVALGWLAAALASLLGPDWSSGDGVRAFLDEHSELALPFLSGVADGVVRPGAVAVAWVVLAVQLYCGLALLLGRTWRTALTLGMLLSTATTALGAVGLGTAVLVMQIVLLLAVLTGAIGQPGARTWRPRWWMAIATLVIAVALAPFIRTTDPHRLTADPAAALCLIAFVAGATLVLLVDLHGRADAEYPPDPDDAEHPADPDEPEPDDAPSA